MLTAAGVIKGQKETYYQCRDKWMKEHDDFFLTIHQALLQHIKTDWREEQVTVSHPDVHLLCTSQEARRMFFRIMREYGYEVELCRKNEEVCISW